MIIVVDYGMGNLKSVSNALSKVGAKVKVSTEPAEIKKAEKIILPGVGAFGDAVFELKKRKLFEVIKEEVLSGKHFLGICLGLQLLFDKSEESPNVNGFGLIKGEVRKFSTRVKIPQIGWNAIKLVDNCPLFKGIQNNTYLYFCHSYFVVLKDKAVTAAVTKYGVEFTSAIWEKNIFGVQFHPEKSQRFGLKILENFVKL